MRTRMFFVVAGLMGMQLAFAAETATVIRAAQLTAAPYTDAESIGVLRGETPVEIVERQGGWYQVRTDDGRNGWVRLSSLRLGETKQEEKGGFWASLFSYTGRSQARTASATTGIRGLSEEEIVAAEPDTAALERLSGFAADDVQARQFADEIGLAARQVDELPKTGEKDRKRSRK